MLESFSHISHIVCQYFNAKVLSFFARQTFVKAGTDHEPGILCNIIYTTGSRILTDVCSGMQFELQYLITVDKTNDPIGRKDPRISFYSVYSGVA